MAYVSFFLGAAFFAARFFFAAGFALFLAAADLASTLEAFFALFLAAVFALFLAAAFFATGFLAAAFRPLTAGTDAGVARRGGTASGDSLIGGSACPMADPSISTTSDQSRW